MNASKITYWISTAIVCLMMALSVFMYLTSPDIKTAFAHLGFPDWFRVELAVAKLLGLIVLAIPLIPTRIKEWAYAGFAINFISAIIAHAASGDGAKGFSTPLFLLIVLVVSYVSYHKTIGKVVA